MKNRREFIKKGILATSLLGIPYSSHSVPPKKNTSLKTLDDLRNSLLLEKELIYFNTGSLGPSPTPVIEAVHQGMLALETNPVKNNWGESGILLEKVREKAAAFIHAEKEEVALLRNTTEGMNFIASGMLNLQKGDEILTTNHEHGGGLSGWNYLQKHLGITVREAEVPLPFDHKKQAINWVLDNVRENTKVVLLSHINTITGDLMPLREIQIALRKINILLIVDGAQALGMVNIDMKDLGVDAYVSSGHKWLMASKGTGIMYIRKEAQEIIQPMPLFSNYNSYSASIGTRNISNYLGMGKAFDIQNEIGKSLIEKGGKELAQYLLKELKKHPGYWDIISSPDESMRSSIISINLKKGNQRDLFNKLGERNIIVKVLPKYNALRFSCHAFLRRNDVDELMRNLVEIMNNE
ncbi:MAG: aminotransferase class V-fold PLP-dependent enzyme [Cyclobacteriaceae bacterium]|nr:aminotransferase class V-fold PLP-dependent enzyme [Cyclobacteriaceae bacterium]